MSFPARGALPQGLGFQQIQRCGGGPARVLRRAGHHRQHLHDLLGDGLGLMAGHLAHRRTDGILATLWTLARE